MILVHFQTRVSGSKTNRRQTGWRIASEILPLEWRQVDFSAGISRLFPGMTKNRKGRVFPFTSDLQAVLEGQWIEAVRLKAKGVTCPYVFNRKGKVIRDFRSAWRKACEKAGVSGRIPHDLRRTAVEESRARRGPGACRHATDRASDP